MRLNEDRPPNNVTSPGPIPIDLSICKLRIKRETNGIFVIEPGGKKFFFSIKSIQFKNITLKLYSKIFKRVRIENSNIE